MSAVGRVKKFVSRVGAVGKPSDVGNAEVVEEATKQIPHAVGNLRDVRKWIKEEPGAYQEVLERRKKHLKSLVRIRRAARKDLQEANFRRGVARIGVGTAVAGAGVGGGYYGYRKYKKKKEAGVNWKGIGLMGGGMAGGALSGALVGAHEARKRSPIRPTNKEIDAKYKMIAARVKAHQDPTYVNKTRAANAQLAYEVERAGREHPKGHIARRASQGAVAGGLTAPALAYGGKRLYKILKGSAS